MNAIVSMMWDRQAGSVLARHLADRPAVLYLRPGYSGTQEPLTSQLAQLGAQIVLLPSLLGPAVVAGLQAQAAMRARRIAEDLTVDAIEAAYSHFEVDSVKIRAALTVQIAARLYEVFSTVESMVLAAERHRIELLVVNNDVLAVERAAIAWAQAAGVKTLHLVHSVGSAHASPLQMCFHADAIALAAAKCKYVYDGFGIEPERFVLTGCPWYDVLPGLMARREAIRDEFRRARGMALEDRLVMFATTWFSGYGALERPNVYEETARTVFRAMRFVRERMPDVRLVFKDRPNNAGLRGIVHQIAAEEGVAPEGWVFVEGDPLPVLIAVDVLICIHSSIATEAAAVGVPVINVWDPVSWLIGPCFSGDDGVIEAPPEHLADTLLRLLDDPSDAKRAISEGGFRTEGIIWDGHCTERLSALMGEMRSQSLHVIDPQASRRVSRADAGDRRITTLDRIEAANCVLDLRCGDGRRAHELRTRFPAAKLIGLDPEPMNVSEATKFLDVVAVGTGTGDEIERLELGATTVDVVLLFDVLARVRDPWDTLRRLRPFLMPSARLFVSFQNARSPAAIVGLLEGVDLGGPGGAYAYDTIQRFTLTSAAALFNACGYSIVQAEGVPDPFSPLPAPPYSGPMTFDTGRVVLKDIQPREIAELRVTELLLVARPQL